LANQQFVAQRFAQAPQCIAGCRLGDGQLLRCARQAALGHHCVEYFEQVEVKGAQVELLGPGWVAIR